MQTGLALPGLRVLAPACSRIRPFCIANSEATWNTVQLLLTWLWAPLTLWGLLAANTAPVFCIFLCFLHVLCHGPCRPVQDNCLSLSSVHNRQPLGKACRWRDTSSISGDAFGSFLSHAATFENHNNWPSTSPMPQFSLSDPRYHRIVTTTSWYCFHRYTYFWTGVFAHQIRLGPGLDTLVPVSKKRSRFKHSWPPLHLKPPSTKLRPIGSPGWGNRGRFLAQRTILGIAWDCSNWHSLVPRRPPSTRYSTILYYKNLTESKR